MKKLYFHIGSGRCGSTLIQAIFNDKMLHDIFTKHRRKYDPQIYLDTGKAAHDETFIEAHWRPIKEKYFAPMADSEFEGYFITQENLLGMRSKKGQENICEVSCEKIEYLADGHDIHIIIVIRRQDTYIESLYNQVIKRAETRDFQTFIADFPLSNWHWADNIDIYRDRFGADKVTVVPLEQKLYEGSNRSGFLDAVLMATGVTTRLSFQNLPVVNPSLAPRAIEIQRLANKQLHPEEAARLADWLALNIQKRPDDPHELMSESLRAEIVAFYRESNTRLCDEYLADYPAAKAYYTGEAAA